MADLTHRLLLLPLALFLFAALTPARAQAPRVSAAYTAWDDYYLYAAFQVSDTNVISTNRTPTSQPQQDDNIEVFLETDGPGKADTRTDKTFQMAVSAGSGAYFSQGDGTKIPKAKLVLTYKYASTVDGPINSTAAKDIGYTIEVAIPWTELGLSGPPSAGETWGFNVISRDRSSLQTPADKFVSLSPLVQSEDDIQNPSKWTKIQFVDTIASMNSTTDVVYCPRVKAQYPVIDGVVRSGEWNKPDGFSFGENLIAGPAPTVAEEPNISLSPFSSEAVATPVPGTTTTTPAKPSEGYDILLPGGGTIHVGRMPNPTPTAPETPTVTPYGPTEAYTPPAKGKKKGKKGSNTQVAQVPTGESSENPLTPKGYGPIVKPLGPTIDTTQSLPLPEQTRLGSLIIAPFYINQAFKKDGATDLVGLDQPMDGAGIWAGGLQVGWDVNQVRDARRAGVDVLLAVYDPSDPSADAELDTLVEAIKEIRANGEDYPLLGLRLIGTDNSNAVNAFFSRVPADLCAEVTLPDSDDNKPAYIAVVDSLPDNATASAQSYGTTDSGHALILATPSGSANVKLATVSPGGRDNAGHITGRALAQTYQASWQNAIGSDADWIYLDSWNDYRNGTEIAASRQYGEQYADLTKVMTLAWDGQNEWHAKYLSNSCPAEIAPDTLYTVTIRLENAGSLPWRVGEGYSLCYRWYKDGRLYDDSAPRVPLTQDIYPGQSATVGVGVLAQNSYGGAIEPGDYVLVFDLIQGQDRWFSYAGDMPLKVHVKVLGPSDTVPGYRIRTLATSTPSIMQAGAPYQATVIVRNEGSQTWAAGAQIVAEDLVRVPDGPEANVLVGKTALAEDVPPGSIAYVSVPIQIGATQDKSMAIGWAIQPSGSTQPAGLDQTHTDHVTLVSRDAGVSFALSDIPRHLRTSDKTTAKLGLVNLGPETWQAGAYKVGYHWTYLDGTPMADGADLTPITTTVASGRGATITAKFQAPEYPGRYNLVWDVMLPNGKWASASSASHTASLLVAQVWVTGDKDALTVPVDLSKDFNTVGIGFESAPKEADFDGQGHSLPGEMLPPDGSTEVNGNPLLIGQAGPNLYPSGYYCASTDNGANHQISFLYPTKRGNNVIACKGQTIDLPDGRYHALHLLATATASGDPSVAANFGLVYGEGTELDPMPVADWDADTRSRPGNPVIGSLAFESPYRLGPDGIDSSEPCALNDYPIKLDPNKRFSKITLPNDPRIKILAITLEK
jgi:hypothetical protein